MNNNQKNYVLSPLFGFFAFFSSRHMIYGFFMLSDKLLKNVYTFI